MYSGYPNDVNNSISFYDAYNPGATMIAGNVGVPAGNNGVAAGGTYPAGSAVVSAAQSGNGRAAAAMAAPSGGVLGAPVTWWLSLLAIFAGVIFISRRYGGEERFSNIRGSLYNLTFLTVYVILILNVLKVLAARYPIPGLSKLILAA
jgi:hypothetical protein